MTTVFDAAGEGSAKACWALMRRAREDKHESASSAAKPSPSQGLAFCRTEKPDTYWSAVLVRTPGAERPVISVVEIGYVRRSEVKEDFDHNDGGIQDSICIKNERERHGERRKPIAKGTIYKGRKQSDSGKNDRSGV